ncbi:MAG: DNA polymerase III subunit gamma/tau [Truepera sp.]|nr:DNA polymerase III subunit gamma/tau [Truepera sp.]
MAAIYQQARPHTFAQVVGQEHVKEVLVTAIAKARLGHAYLFSGPRGVGKTTTARLLAMAVNCQAVPSARPCGDCASCRLVRQGSHPDVIELDAASNNSVEDVRDLREKVGLSAALGGTRVWILDEAHMLSRAASNALLKTLEEPPAQLLFVLATTEPEKLPPTILSRCQHFRFRRLSETEIAAKLAQLCHQADVPAEPSALQLVAKAADGAMRDAESLLERLLAIGEITHQAAEEALGLPPQSRLYRLAQHLAARHVGELLSNAAALYQDGFSPRSLCHTLTLTLREALYSKTGLTPDGPSLDLSEAELLRAIHTLDDEDARFVRRDDLFALEVALIKVLNTLSPATVLSSEPQTVSNEAAQPKPVHLAPSETAQLNWRDLLSQAGPQLKAFMMPAQADVDGNRLTLTFPDSHRFHFEQLKRRQAELEELVRSVAGNACTVVIQGTKEGLSLRSEGEARRSDRDSPKKP